MKCPNDGATLTMSERSGVEIDYCPECRGVWLDRGELDKILDRAASDTPAAAPPPGYQQPGYQQPGYQQPGYQQPGYQQPGSQEGRDSYRGQGGRRPKRKEHWLAELFD
jgi:Zn-finger nucleic acid-binding protein